LNVRAVIVFAAFSLTAVAETPVLAPEIIVQQFCAATRNQALHMTGASMDVEIAGSLPKLKKEGKMHALRRISALGRITYDFLTFEGDGTVKKQVINRYLSAEAEAVQDPSLAVSPDNYKFKYKGKIQLDGRDTYLFDVSPKKKRAGLYQGQLWIDAETYLRAQESGYLVKNPSILLKKVAFVRKYEIRDGISVLRKEQSVVDTRIAGKAEMTIDFSNYSMDEPGNPPNQ
jgi:hypothetical protein